MTPDDTALLAIEQRVRVQIAAQLSNINTRFGAFLGAVVAKTDPHTSATEILSRYDVHEVLTTTLDSAQAEVEDRTRAAYEAAVALALIALAAEFQPLGHDVPSTLVPPVDYIDALLASVRTAFHAALLDIHNSIRAAYDGVTGDRATAARVLTTNAALKRAIRRLGVRVTAAGVVAVHRGFTETQLAAYRDYEKINPYVVIEKRWETTAIDPCPTCQALDGTTLALDAEFDRGDTLPVYRNLLGPPRHPNCRCRLALVVGSDRIRST